MSSSLDDLDNKLAKFRCATRNLTIFKTVASENHKIFRSMLRKMREIETKSGFAKQRRGEEGVALLCWKEAISRVSNAAPASLSHSLLDFGRKWTGRSTKAAQNTVSIHGSPPETRHGIPCCLPSSRILALKNNIFVLPHSSLFYFVKLLASMSQ